MIDDVAETMSIFQEKVALAKDLKAEGGDGWVETTPEIIAILKPRGLGVHNGAPVEHFCYHGVIVCAKGKKESIQAKMDEPLNNKMHGSLEAKVVSGN